jgi:hypothetical protein
LLIKHNIPGALINSGSQRNQYNYCGFIKQ